jgi:lipopolysaccharide export system protein LptC
MTSGIPPKKLRLPMIVSWLVLAAILAMVAVFVVKAGMFASLVQKPPKPVQNQPIPDRVSSAAATITGFDKDQQPYELTARSVLQDATNDKLAHMKTVTGILRKKSGAKLLMQSDRAAYFSDKKILDLSGNIKLVSLDRFTAYLEKARVTLKDKRLYAKVPVTVIFDRGSIKANGIDVTENGKRILFFNGVKTLFDGEGSTARDDKTDKKGN